MRKRDCAVPPSATVLRMHLSWSCAIAVDAQSHVFVRVQSAWRVIGRSAMSRGADSETVRRGTRFLTRSEPLTRAHRFLTQEGDARVASLLFRLGQFSARCHWLVIISWMVLLGISALTFSMFSGPISTALSIPGTKTDQVQAQLAEKFPAAQGGTGTIVFTTADGEEFSEGQRHAVATFLDDLDGNPDVKESIDGFATQQDLDLQRQKITEGRAKLEDAQAQLADNHAQLDAQLAHAGPAAASDPQFQQAQQAITDAQERLDRTAVEMEQAAVLLTVSEGIHFVPESGSAAIGTVT